MRSHRVMNSCRLYSMIIKCVVTGSKAKEIATCLDFALSYLWIMLFIDKVTTLSTVNLS